MVIEEGEDSTACAIREALEETGYKIHTYKKIGEYYRPKVNDIQHVFLGEVIGGEAIIFGDETSKLKWFKLNSLPLLMVPHRKEQIRDYLKGESNLVKSLKDSDVIMKIKRILIKH